MHPLDVITTAPLAYAAAMSVFNAAAWPSDAAIGRSRERVSVLIPARNEEATIRRCVTAALAVDPPVHEVIVCDDDSDDATPDILAELAATDDRLRVIRGRPLPAGWVGKPHACHQLGEAATGDLLVFVDADVTLHRQAAVRLRGVLTRHAADVVTLFPQQRTPTVGEQLVLPLLPLTFAAWFPLPAVHAHPDPRLMAVSGQVVAFRRPAYADIGGYASIRAEIVDDQAICTRAKAHGHRVVFATGQRTATCRMYEGFHDLFTGFSKNLYEGLGESVPALLGVIALYTTCFLWPYVRLVGELAWLGQASAVAWLGVGLNLLARSALAVRLRQSALSVLLHPVGVVALLAIAVNSMRWNRAGAVQWRGRTYGARADRG